MAELRSATFAADTALGAVGTHVPLAAVTRGAVVESVHYGAVAVTDAQGRLLYAAGDPQILTMTRSALKPFQAMPFVAAGGIDRFGFNREQVALLCASHSGEARHVNAVADMLAKSGSRVDELQCGTHPPGFYDVRGEVPPPPPWSPVAHNCSGKHSGMLAYCVHCQLPKTDYLDFDHPLQQSIRKAVAHFTGTAEDQLAVGIDGCSAPNYGVPLSGLATAYARLASERNDSVYGASPRILADAMTAHPEMVSGEGRNDLAYMQAGRGDWVTKVGAEGVQGIGIRSSGIGIAVKVADGAKRGLHPAVVEVLDQLGLLDAEQRRQLSVWREPTLRNYRGIATGAVQPLVVLYKLRDMALAAQSDPVAPGRW